MIGDTTNVTNSSGSINVVSGAIGNRNQVVGNESNICNSFNLSETSDHKDFVSALQQLKNELSKAHELPEDDSEDLKSNIDAAIKASENTPPKKGRIIEKLSAMQKILDSLKNSVSSAVSLGKLVSEVLLASSKLM